MTDKVQKIREEVERLRKSYQIMYQELDCESPELMSVCAKRNLCQDILMFIDSMQEEPKPKFKVGDHIRPIDSSLGAPRTILEVCDGWYVTNQGTLDFEYEDNWELVREPVSDELEEAAKRYGTEGDEISGLYIIDEEVEAFKAGAQWQKEQFEKNRLAACDRQTEEEAEIERDFVMGIIEKEYRQPTFDDAIEYGMRLQKEQMMANVIDAHHFGLQDEALFYFKLPADNYFVGSKVKVFVIKED